jgi:hypothetical protein
MAYPEPLPAAPPRPRRRLSRSSVQPRRARVEPIHARADPVSTMGKKKDSKNAAPTAHAADQPRLSHYPKAQQQINNAKAWGGLVLFLLLGFVSMQQGLPAFTVGVRALVAGMIGYVVAWAIALIVWRQVAINEVESLRARLLAEHESDSADVAA